MEKINKDNLIDEAIEKVIKRIKGGKDSGYEFKGSSKELMLFRNNIPIDREEELGVTFYGERIAPGYSIYSEEEEGKIILTWERNKRLLGIEDLGEEIRRVVINQYEANYNFGLWDREEVSRIYNKTMRELLEEGVIDSNNMECILGEGRYHKEHASKGMDFKRIVYKLTIQPKVIDLDKLGLAEYVKDRKPRTVRVHIDQYKNTLIKLKEFNIPILQKAIDREELSRVPFYMSIYCCLIRKRKEHIQLEFKNYSLGKFW